MIGISNMQPQIINSINRVDTRMATVNQELTSGKKTLNAAEEGIVTRLNSDIAGFGSARDNISRSTNVVTVAQAALSSIADIMTEMKELATNSASDNVSAVDKDKLNETFASLLLQIDDLVNSAEIDGINLVKAGSADLDIQVGLSAGDSFTIPAQASSITDLSINALSIASGGDPAAAITALETAIGTVSASQSSLGAVQTGLESRDNTVSTISDSLTDTVGDIEHVDLEILRMEMEQLKMQKNIDYWLVGVFNDQVRTISSLLR
jgi:flagellin